MAQQSAPINAETIPSTTPKVDYGSRNPPAANGHSLNGTATSDASTERTQIINDEKEFKYVVSIYVTLLLVC